jgi:hypothetical protein
MSGIWSGHRDMVLEIRSKKTSVFEDPGSVVRSPERDECPEAEAVEWAKVQWSHVDTTPAVELSFAVARLT